jgi:hypothetical protein
MRIRQPLRSGAVTAAAVASLALSAYTSDADTEETVLDTLPAAPGESLDDAIATEETVDASVSETTPRSITLPAGGEYPEGIAIDAGTAYVTSASTGEVFAGALAGDTLELFAPAPDVDVERLATGITTAGGFVYVAGADTQQVRVYDSDGGIVATASSDVAGFLNDLVVANGYVYVTDSTVPTIWRFPADATGDVALEPWADVSTSISYTEDSINLNGIAPGSDGTLVTVNATTGQLYAVDLNDGAASEIDLGGGDLTNGDGIVGEGNTLWVVLNAQSTIARIDLEGSTAVVTRGAADETLDFPTTGEIDADGNLWVVNSQFDKRGEPGTYEAPSTSFTIATTALP